MLENINSEEKFWCMAEKIVLACLSALLSYSGYGMPKSRMSYG
jgi:hypothetical protein